MHLYFHLNFDLYLLNVLYFHLNFDLYLSSECVVFPFEL